MNPDQPEATPTPRTDAAIAMFDHSTGRGVGHVATVSEHFARTLERELAEEKAKLFKAGEDYYRIADAACRSSDGVEDLIRQIRATRSENATLQASLADLQREKDALAQEVIYYRGFSIGQVSVQDFYKAKAENDRLQASLRELQKQVQQGKQEVGVDREKLREAVEEAIESHFMVQMQFSRPTVDFPLTDRILSALEPLLVTQPRENAETKLSESAESEPAASGTAKGAIKKVVCECLNENALRGVRSEGREQLADAEYVERIMTAIKPFLAPGVSSLRSQVRELGEKLAAAEKECESRGEYIRQHFPTTARDTSSNPHDHYMVETGETWGGLGAWRCRTNTEWCDLHEKTLAALATSESEGRKLREALEEIKALVHNEEKTAPAGGEVASTCDPRDKELAFNNGYWAAAHNIHHDVSEITAALAPTKAT